MTHMNIESLLAQATEQLKATSTTPRLDAQLLLTHQLGVSREYLLMNPDKLLENNDIKAFTAYVERRQQGEPIAYITGIKQFWSLDFCVTRDTLIPRPDSETLVDAALKLALTEPALNPHNRAWPTTLLDIGTGSGCLLIALLNAWTQSRGVGLDVNERALRVAEENAVRLGVSGRAQWVHSHWCDAIEGTFDLIASNPPYIADNAMSTLMRDVVDFEPHLALAAGADGLDAYRALAPQVAKRLNGNGACIFEIGQGQEHDVAALLEAQGLVILSQPKDLAGITRCIVARKARNTH